ncbi:MAG: hypothetical protein J2P58_13905 [Acidimicrobiaceae bacterium]|nr:hypothetical protein [Acidimicrobiaceae bacterium]
MANTSPTSTTAAAPSTRVAPAVSPSHPCDGAPTPPARYRHVVWIWMENHSWSSVIGGPSAHYISTLAHECGTDLNYAAVGSPSLPNYLGATSGSTQGVTDDGDPGEHSFTVNNLFRQVRTAGGTERSFAESMPGNCGLVSDGSYAPKHNPAIYYDGPGDRAACRADDEPFAHFSEVLARGTLPTYTSITPNLCDDMHDCPVTAGDRWLATWVPRILATPSYESGTTALFIMWDEPTPLANVVVAPSVRPGTVSRVAVDHYSLLRATEEMLGLPLLGRAASAPSLRSVLGL